MNYTSLLELLSACGVSCLLINNENTIISVNERADLLLDGSGQLPGKKLPDVLIPQAKAMVVNPMGINLILDKEQLNKILKR